jgi:hypothetical protein
MRLRALVGVILGLLVWAWLRTLRLRVVDRTSEAARGSSSPWVLVFFHGTQVPLLAWRRRRRTAVLVSLSKDGELQARVMARNGMVVVRGSSSRGGARGLAAMVRALRAARSAPAPERGTGAGTGDGELDAAFAVDGPRGPYGAVQPGALACARHTRGMLVPIGSACAPAKRFERAWDRFALPWPFARAVVVVGPELPADTDASVLAGAIGDANAEAARRLAGASAEPGARPPIAP